MVVVIPYNVHQTIPPEDCLDQRNALEVDPNSLYVRE